jgi:hypothetical protein
VCELKFAGLNIVYRHVFSCTNAPYAPAGANMYLSVTIFVVVALKFCDPSASWYGESIHHTPSKNVARVLFLSARKCNNVQR